MRGEIWGQQSSRGACQHSRGCSYPLVHPAVGNCVSEVLRVALRFRNRRSALTCAETHPYSRDNMILSLDPSEQDPQSAGAARSDQRRKLVRGRDIAERDYQLTLGQPPSSGRYSPQGST